MTEWPKSLSSFFCVHSRNNLVFKPNHSTYWLSTLVVEDGFGYRPHHTCLKCLGWLNPLQRKKRRRGGDRRHRRNAFGGYGTTFTFCFPFHSCFLSIVLLAIFLKNMGHFIEYVEQFWLARTAFLCFPLTFDCIYKLLWPIGCWSV